MVRSAAVLLLLSGLLSISGHPWWFWLRKIGGVGLLCLGLTDGSVVPIPGGTDALTILLSARHHELWIYYAGMATLGSVIGGLLTYRVGQRHGQQALLRRVGQSRARKFSWIFARWGFYAVAIPAMLPVPVSPFLLTAGATHYARRKFLSALTLGRAVKFLALAFFAATYGRKAAVRTLDHYGTILLWGLAVAAIIGTSIAASWKLREHRVVDETHDESDVARVEQIGA
ncbi:MAG TPA: VTT domain-containing protein [Candidatus Limnocylindrales bacterium]|jgi:membrane protein YqaA with SNARE-associated domain|nr:VTT domain-containing protein [Candidatus Limnocylindrales bacterium]